MRYECHLLCSCSLLIRKPQDFLEKQIAFSRMLTIINPRIRLTHVGEAELTDSSAPEHKSFKFLFRRLETPYTQNIMMYLDKIIIHEKNSITFLFMSLLIVWRCPWKVSGIGKGYYANDAVVCQTISFSLYLKINLSALDFWMYLYLGIIIFN